MRTVTDLLPRSGERAHAYLLLAALGSLPCALVCLLRTRLCHNSDMRARMRHRLRQISRQPLHQPPADLHYRCSDHCSDRCSDHRIYCSDRSDQKR